MAYNRNVMRDSDVRSAVRRILHTRYGDDPETRIVEEMGLYSGAARIDIAVINGELLGIELKSDRDTLTRLAAQAAIYSRIFDRMELVVGSRHIKKIRSCIPKWWGVLVATSCSGTIKLERDVSGNTNPKPDPTLIAQLLWRSEAVDALEAFGFAKGWRGKRVALIHKRLAAEVELGSLRAYVRATLKKRQRWLGQPVGNKGEMTISADGHPGSSIACTGSLSSDLLNTLIAPAIG
jgi:hypothetical protein